MTKILKSQPVSKRKNANPGAGHTIKRIHISTELHKKLKIYAVAHGRFIQEVAEEAMSDFLSKSSL